MRDKPKTLNRSKEINLIPESIADATAQMAVRCESAGHEFKGDLYPAFRGCLEVDRCVWCGKERE